MRAKLALILGLLLTALAAAPGRPAAAQQPPRWGLVTGVADVDFTAVFMLDATRAWAVGNYGDQGRLYRLRLADAGWEPELETVFDQPVADLSVISPAEIWVTGQRGQIAHLVDGAWQRHQFEPELAITSIQLLGDGSLGWAGGHATDASGRSDAVMLRYQNGAWQRQELPEATGSRLADLHFASQDAGWAVGDRLWRYRRGAWTAERIPDPCGTVICSSAMAGVRALGPDTAMAVGSTAAPCGACRINNYALWFDGAGWQQAEPASYSSPTADALFGLALDANGDGFAIGFLNTPDAAGYGPDLPAVYRRSAGAWSLETLPVRRGRLASVSIAPGGGSALAVGDDGLILSFNDRPRPNPTVRVGKPIDPDALYFEQVGHSLRGAFRRYWERNGGLPVFGFPLTEQFDEQSGPESRRRAVHYVERQRFELHPENAGTPYEVQLGLLGKELLAAKGVRWDDAGRASPDSPHYYPQTGQAIAPEFWDYWRSHGLEFGAPGVSEAEALALFGYPISPARVETNSSGDRVLTQWFERARFEHHPANPAESRVLLGRLAAELLAERGW